MDKRKECSYKEKCYRKKYEHFEQFKHPHLDELLEKIGDHEIHIPFGYIAKVSFATLKLQLEIERKINEVKNSSINSEPEVKRRRVSDVNSLLNHNDELFTEENIANDRNITSTENDRVASPLKRSQTEKKSSPDKSNVQNCSNNKIDELSISEPSTSRRSLESAVVPNLNEPGTSSSQNTSQPGSSKKTFEKQRVGSSRHAENMREAEAFRSQIDSQIHTNIGDKLRAAAPYNILYTSLEASNFNYVPDRLTVTFPELLESPLGLLEDSLLINFMVQFGWVLACYFTRGHSNKPMTLLYGECDIDLGKKFDKFLKFAKIKPPSSFGSHHTKMMMFYYLDKSIRVVICTANLVESDWVNRTQGVWISDKCEEMLPGDEGGESKTNFKQDLLTYLEAYNVPILEPWIERVKKADMSHINVFFIGSIPGSHQMAQGKWGQARMRSVLKKHAPVVENNSYKVITQISSIGSLGPNPSSWLMNDILTTFATTKPPSSLVSRPSLSVIYPSFSNVETSVDGLLGGGCLPYSSVTHRKQEWLSEFLHNWKSDLLNRTKSVPHIKSYTRVSHDNSKISYFLLTSANLSKAAWGTISKSQSLNILSYEAGVLLLPEFVLGGVDYFPLDNGTNDSNEIHPKFSLPYDVPLSPYGIYDIPWFIDNLPM